MNKPNTFNLGEANLMAAQQAHALLEQQLGHNPELLAAAKAQMDEIAAVSPEKFLGMVDNSPKAKIKKCRQEKAQKQYQAICEVLDEPIRQLLLLKRENENHDRISAVDLAAGSAYFTSQWALRYREPFFQGHQSMEWYPTDTKEALAQFTRPCLEYLAQEAETRKKDQQNSSALPLCTDPNGTLLFPKARIVLQGLTAEAYNGREGVLLYQDPANADRYAVRLLDPSRLLLDELQLSKQKPMSFQAKNLTSILPIEEQQLLRLLRQQQPYTEQDFFRELHERSCALDLLRQETWSKLLDEQGQRGKCGLVTCTNLLTEIGHCEPNAWKIVMEIAADLLLEGGYLLHGDTDGWGPDFGNPAASQAHASSLGFTLETRVELDASWVIMLWKKSRTVVH